jgi:hypothetical protein
LTNHLLGPSYVSLVYALALHGLIPEGVAEIKSVTPRSSRTLSNSYGRFSYIHLPLPLPFYALGQQLGEGPDGLCYLIASPNKALVDRLALTRNLAPLSRAAVRQWLLEDLRLDEGLLSKLSLEEIRRYQATGFKQRQLGTLLSVLKGLQEELS